MKPKRVTTAPQPNNTPNRQRAIDVIRQRKQQYQATFDIDNQADRAVLRDLAEFCRVGKTTFHENRRVSDLLEGRREVALRILNHIGLSEQDLYAIFVEGE